MIEPKNCSVCGNESGYSCDVMGYTIEAYVTCDTIGCRCISLETKYTKENLINEMEELSIRAISVWNKWQLDTPHDVV